MNNEQITAADVTSFLKSVGFQFNKSLEMKEDFMKLYNMTSSELLKVSETGRKWYFDMNDKIMKYKKEQVMESLYSRLGEFESDIAKYTSNEKKINSFRGINRIIWLSYSDNEKKEVVERLETIYPSGKKSISKSNKDNRIEKILSDRKKSEEALKNWTEEDVSIYDDKETVQEYAKKNGGKVVDELTEKDIDELFDNN